MGYIGGITLLLLLMVISANDGAIPGTFFWKPRMDLEMHIPKSKPPMFTQPANQKTIREGLVVMLDKYQAGMTLLGLAAGVAATVPSVSSNEFKFLHVSMCTKTYQWMMRHLSLVQYWLAGKTNYINTHRVWQRRFHYVYDTVPSWLTYLCPQQEMDSWKSLYYFHEDFKENSRPFAKHLRYPNKHFSNFKSWEESSSESTESSSLTPPP